MKSWASSRLTTRLTAPVQNDEGYYLIQRKEVAKIVPKWLPVPHRVSQSAQRHKNVDKYHNLKD